jgi:hypothetical protein
MNGEAGAWHAGHKRGFRLSGSSGEGLSLGDDCALGLGLGLGGGDGLAVLVCTQR